MVSSSQQNTSLITLNLRLNANADRAVTDVLSKVNQVKYLLPREALDPVVVKQAGQSTALMYMSFNSADLTRAADQRLSVPRRPARAANHRRRRQRPDPRRPEFRDARLARSRPHGGARRDRGGHPPGADRQQFHLRRRPDQVGLHAGLHRRADLARKRQGVFPAHRVATGATRWCGSAMSPKSSSGRKTPNPPPCSTGSRRCSSAFTARRPPIR